MKCLHPTCQNTLTGRRRKFCSTRCCQSGVNHRHQNYVNQQQRGLNRKVYLVKLLGGGCSKCGYNKNYAGLDFHHLRDKKHQLDLRNLSNRSWKAILQEVEKCILLCRICHTEHHNPTMFADVVKLPEGWCPQ